MRYLKIYGSLKYFYLFPHVEVLSQVIVLVCIPIMNESGDSLTGVNGTNLSK